MPTARYWIHMSEPGARDLANDLLLAALESIAAPSFVVSAAGSVLFKNQLAEQLLRRAPEMSAVAHREWQAGSARQFAVEPVGQAGSHALVVLRPASSAERHAMDGSRRWGLTSRQREVLSHLALGKTNRATAVELGCAERTVEVHVAAIMRKAKVASRTQLLSSLLGH